MGSKDIDRKTKNIVENHVEKVLQKEPTGIFSKKEVTKKVKQRINWTGSGNNRKLAEMHQTGQIDRRKFLQMLGLGAGGAFVATSGVGYFMGTKIFDQGNHNGLLTGLQTGGNTGSTDYSNLPGDNVIQTSSIDEAISAFQEDGNTVVLASGEYDYGGGIESSASNTTLVGDGEVTWNLGGTNDGRLTGDNLLLKNITISGESSGGKSGIDISEGEVTLENVNMPDGGSEDEDRAYYAPEDSGKAIFKGCYWANFPSDGAYMDNMPSEFHCCLAENNGVNGIRIGQGGSTVKNSVVLVTETDITKPRGIHVREGGEDMLIENCDLSHEAGPPIELDDSVAKTCTGVLRNTRIENNGGNSLISEGNSEFDWTMENVQAKGSGSMEYPEDSISGDIQTGGDFTVRTAPDNCQYSTGAGSPSAPGGSGGSTGGTGGTGGSGGSGGTGTTQPGQPVAEDWTPIVLEGGSRGTPREYMIKADQLKQGDGATGAIFENKVAGGSVEGGSHHYQYKGRLYDLTAESNITVRISREEVTPQDILQLTCG